MRPRQFWVYITMYILAITLLLLINGLVKENLNDLKFNRSLFYQFLIFQTIILCLWAAFNSAAAIRDEMTDNSYDFFRLLPLTAHEKTVGILVGKNLVTLLFTAINCFFLFYYALLGKINPILLGQLLITLIVITLLINLLTLLSSVRLYNKRKKTSTIGMIILLLFGIPQIIGALYGFTNDKPLQSYLIAFYQFDIPVLLLISALAFYFSTWAYRGIIRKFNKEDEPLFNRLGAIFFMIGYELIVLGLFYPHLEKKFNAPINYSFSLLTLVPFFLIYLASQRNMLTYIEFAGLSSTPNRNQTPGPLTLLKYSNLTLGFILFFIWALGTLMLAQLEQINITQDLYLIACLSLSSLFLILLAELRILYQQNSEKIGFLLGFLVVIYFTLPLLLAGLLENETIIYIISPIGLFSYLFDNKQIPLENLKVHTLTNLGLCIIPILLTIRQYKNILQVRKNM